MQPLERIDQTTAQLAAQPHLPAAQAIAGDEDATRSVTWLPERFEEPEEPERWDGMS